MKRTPEMIQYGLKFSTRTSATGCRKYVPDGKNPAGTREFLAKLRAAADEADRQAAQEKPYKAGLLRQNARAARMEADRIESYL